MQPLFPRNLKDRINQKNVIDVTAADILKKKKGRKKVSTNK